MGIVMFSIIKDTSSNIWFLCCLVWWCLIEPKHGDSIHLMISILSLWYTKCLWWDILLSLLGFPSFHWFVWPLYSWLCRCLMGNDKSLSYTMHLLFYNFGLSLYECVIFPLGHWDLNDYWMHKWIISVVRSS